MEMDDAARENLVGLLKLLLALDDKRRAELGLHLPVEGEVEARELPK